MTQWMFPPSATPSLPIAGRPERFPVRRILCVGQNYAAHAREMGHERAEPFFFAKPADALVADGHNPLYPSATDNLHREVELVGAVGPDGGFIGWAVGCDLTRRDLQAAAKAAGRPWDAAKGFDQSAPCRTRRRRSRSASTARRASRADWTTWSGAPPRCWRRPATCGRSGPAI
jgi:fumarylpyruvate hydrolase